MLYEIHGTGLKNGRRTISTIVLEAEKVDPNRDGSMVFFNKKGNVVAAFIYCPEVFAVDADGKKLAVVSEKYETRSGARRSSRKKTKKILVVRSKKK